MSSEQNQILLESLNSSEMSRFSSGSFVPDLDEEIIVTDPHGTTTKYSGGVGKIKIFSFAERIKRLFNPDNGYRIYILKTDDFIFTKNEIINLNDFKIFLSLEICLAIKDIKTDDDILLDSLSKIKE